MTPIQIRTLEKLPLNEVKAFLKSFLEGDLSVISNDWLGLCFNITEAMGGCGYGLIDNFSSGWPLTRGLSYAPIPENPSFGKYECVNLAYRQSLALYLLNQIDLYEDSLCQT